MSRVVAEELTNLFRKVYENRKGVALFRDAGFLDGGYRYIGRNKSGSLIFKSEGVTHNIGEKDFFIIDENILRQGVFSGKYIEHTSGRNIFGQLGAQRRIYDASNPTKGTETRYLFDRKTGNYELNWFDDVRNGYTSGTPTYTVRMNSKMQIINGGASERSLGPYLINNDPTNGPIDALTSHGTVIFDKPDMTSYPSCKDALGHILKTFA